MFYAHFILKKKGPLSRVWLAAHWDKKLTKANIFETDIVGSIEEMLSPQLKLALRTSGHLLLGVVRIYSRKTKYLLADCNEAFVKIKLAFRPGIVDLPVENREASLATINIREDFTSFDLDIVDFSDLDMNARSAVNQSRPEDITMREEVTCMPYVGDDGFVEDNSLGGPVTVEAIDSLISHFLANSDARLRTPLKLVRSTSFTDSGFGSPGDFGFNPSIVGVIPEVNMDEILFNENLEQDKNEVDPADLLAQQHVARNLSDLMNENGPTNLEHSIVDDVTSNYDDNDDSSSIIDGRMDLGLFGEEEEMTTNHDGQVFYESLVNAATSTSHEKSSAAVNNVKDVEHDDVTMNVNILESRHKKTLPDIDMIDKNTEEVFTLGPIDVIIKERKTKRKRRLIVDQHKVISSEEMKMQLSSANDLIIPLDLAPPTKKLMRWKETGGIDSLFIFPGHPLLNKTLVQVFGDNLRTTSARDEDLENDERRKREEEEEEEEEEREEEEATTKETEISLEIVRRPGLITDKRHGSSDESLFSSDNNHGFVSDIEDPRSSLSIVATTSVVVVDDHRDSSPVSKRHKTSKDANALDPALPPPVELLPSLPIDFPGEDDDTDNDGDDIFDVEVVQTSSNERINLRKELDEAEEEERLWNKRSSKMQNVLQRRLETESKISFKHLTMRNNRKQAASKFYTVLVLTKARSVAIEQNEPYGDIVISRGPNFSGIVV